MAILNLDDLIEKLEVKLNNKTYILDDSFKAAVAFEKKWNDLIFKYDKNIDEITSNESDELLLILFNNNKEPIDYINSLNANDQIKVLINIIQMWIKKVFPQKLPQDKNENKKKEIK